MPASFRSCGLPSPGQYVKSIFACGLICAVTIIPIITSVSREVMSQAPRDVCEAALGLGRTRWGMVTDVILPFSRNGILGAILLGLGRGLGETMIVVLVLSQGDHLTSALMGPGGLGSIAAEITENFVAGSPITKSALILLGLVLVPDHAADQHRGPPGRPTFEPGFAVTQTLEPPSHRRASAQLPTRSTEALWRGPSFHGHRNARIGRCRGGVWCGFASRSAESPGPLASLCVLSAAF